MNARTIAAGGHGPRNEQGFYVLVVIAILTVAVATFIILNGLGRMREAAADIAHRTKVSAAAEQILLIVRDSEMASPTPCGLETQNILSIIFSPAGKNQPPDPPETG